MTLDKKNDLIERLHPRKMTRIEIDFLKGIYKKKPRYRFDEEKEINFLLKVVEDIPFFIQFENQDKIEILKASQLEVQKRGEIIFEQGDTADCMYVILLGSVNVLIKQLHPLKNTLEYTVKNYFLKIFLKIISKFF